MRAVDLILDSGAYSAWVHGIEIDLNAYIEFIKRWESKLWAYVALDVLPSAPGVARTPEAVEASAAASHRNVVQMRDAGLRPLAVFHQGERFHWLEKLLSDGETYIGLSTAKDRATPVQMDWLDKCFSELTDAQGRPLVRTHAFGSVSPRLLFTYPWYSADSTSWGRAAGYGLLHVPNMRSDGTFDYMQQTSVVVSSLEQDKPARHLRDFIALSTAQQDIVIRFLDQECGGITLLDVRYNQWTRKLVNVIYAMKMAEQARGTLFKRRQGRFFGSTKTHNLKPIPDHELYVVFATSTDQRHASLLTAANARHRLLSYHFLKDEESTLDNYIETGTPSGVVSARSFSGRPPPARFDLRYRNYRAMQLLYRLNRYEAMSNAD